jgi:signal transduction histidine kinase
VLTTRRCWLALFFAAALCWIIGGEWVSIHAGVPENHFIDSLGGLSFAIAGVIAADRRPGNALGPLMFGYVFLSYLGNWGNLRVPGLPVIGLMGGQLTGAVLAHIALAYPSGRLQTRGRRWVVGVIYATGSGVCLTLLLTFDPRASGCPCVAEPAPFPSRSGAMTALLVGQRSGIVLVPLFLAAIWLRWMRATPAERRDLLPLWLAVFLLAVVYLLSGFASPDTTGDPFAYLIWELQAILTVGIPAVFVWGLLSTRLARSAVGDLVMDLKRPLGSGELRALLARTLGDPSLGLFFAVDGHDMASGHDIWVDAHGRWVSLPESGTGRQARTATIVEREGRPLAALVHDAALDSGLVRAVAAAAAIRLENERLHADLGAQLDEVRASRQRIVEAGDRERRRVERNLHDGAQQRLVTLVLSLAMLRDRAAADPELVRSLDQSTAELKQAIAELRELARGIHPAILTEEGLPAAVEALADRSSVPVRVQANFDGRLAEPVEAVAYFVVAESIANIIKYSRACAARVELSRSNGMLLLEVADDGVGGADVSAGSGLRGLADRVAAVRGMFGVDSPPGGGTLVRAEIPCDG